MSIDDHFEYPVFKNYIIKFSKAVIFGSITVILLFGLPTSCVQKEKKDHNVPDIDAFFEDYHLKKLEFNPLEATKAGDYRFNDQLPNFISDEFQKSQKAFYNEYRDKIASIERKALTPAQNLSLDVMQWECDIKLEGLQNELVTIASPLFDLPAFELLPIFQISSLHLYIGQLAGGQSIQPFNTPEQYKNWLKRIDGFMTFLDTAILQMKEGLKKDVILPTVLIERVIEQLRPFTQKSLEQNVFYGPVLLLSDEFSDVDKEQIAYDYEMMIEQKVIPKYEELEKFLREEYLPRGRSSAGISDVPGGKEAYEYLIKYHTTTNLTAQEIHDLGKTEVERIGTEMEQIKNEIGFKGNLRSFFDHVRASPDQIPFTRPEQVIENFNQIHERMSPYIDRLFDLKPKGQFVVKRTEAFRESAAAAEYVPGTKDGSRPGTFYVPIPDVRTYNKYSDEALFLHEAIPGHHYQLSLQQENDELPAFLHAEGMGVFVEGWALYSESLGAELGLYADPYQRFGMLSMEMHRAIRLVVDTGIHALGWTREEAIQYSLENEAASEQSIISEIERYMAVPAQALSYKIGQLKIRELRTMAEEVLKEGFDIKEFHNQVLNSGSLPMLLLEKKIGRWIEDQQS